VVERIKHKLATTMMVRTRDNDAVGHATGQQRLSSKSAEIRAQSTSLRPTVSRKVAENPPLFSSGVDLRNETDWVVERNDENRGRGDTVGVGGRKSPS